MRETVFDIETNGFLTKLDKLHVISWQDMTEKEPKSGYDAETASRVFDTDLLIGHNICRFDLPALKKLFGISNGKDTIVVDTLSLAWYLDYERGEKGLRYGLDAYGETFGIKKPSIENWDNLTQEEYTHRCEEDVKINVRLWKRLRNKLVALYGQNADGSLTPDAIRLLRYLSFKMECAAKAEAEGIRIDYDKVTNSLDELQKLRDEKEAELSKAMPKVVLTKVVNKPKHVYKKDGTLSEAGKRWFEHLKEAGLPSDTAGPIKVITGYEDGNPSSTMQVKNWLWGLGWQPLTYKFVKDDDGTERQIEQVRKDGELCPSVLDLSEHDPAIHFLDGLTVLNHRIGILKGFRDLAFQKEDGTHWIESKIDGLTNTFRFKHRAPLVNLPGVDKPYGELIRSCILAPSDDHVLIGADMVSLEDTTKRHYMQPLDPEYVEEMSREGFDPHLDLAKYAGVCTQEEIDEYAGGGAKHLKPIRKNFKAANYSCIYGVGAPKLARTLNTSVSEASLLINAYWERNWSIKKVSSMQKTKVLKDGSMWLQNPVSGFWHSLRNAKDIFSTLNQSTGVYVFDNWLAIIIQSGIPVIMQYHDEYLGYIPRDGKQECDSINQDAITRLNQKLQLNVPVGSDWHYGENYADVH